METIEAIYEKLCNVNGIEKGGAVSINKQFPISGPEFFKALRPEIICSSMISTFITKDINQPE